ncbi:hypothetical protein [Mesoterricola sediminis]|uniref:Uncharacterized protein n=1 Tax=Mesoterricola sediminis TaxID=2927980 RepID=A0AA48KCS8_9BACT|nr:hypothetical protein [Mesoterricola sediminis]BDU77421.1 hypothetical protein METESE_23790 [Mesoterricola sediminis]
MFDERFIIHRYKATSHAAVAGAGVLCAFLIRGLLRGEGLHRDLMAVLVVMAVTKVIALTYLRLRG